MCGSCPASWGRVVLSPAEHCRCVQDTWLSLGGAGCPCLAVRDFLCLCPQLTAPPILSAPARTFPTLPAPSWSRLHHRMRTGRSIAGKRAQGPRGPMAPAQQQKVGEALCSPGAAQCVGHQHLLAGGSGHSESELAGALAGSSKQPCLICPGLLTCSACRTAIVPVAAQTISGSSNY